MPYNLSSIPRQEGRIAIVTGANMGLGFETTRAFAQKGITTVMACRTESRANQAIAKIKAEIPDAKLIFLPLDLSDLASVRAFASSFRDAYGTLDLLILNAGIMAPPYSKTIDGFESQMGANFFGHFLLTSLLIDLMPDQPASRIVTLSSNAHRMGKQRIYFEDLNWEREYSALVAYAQTKLACLMFANTLDRRLKDQSKSIQALSAHPGLSLTNLSSSGSTLSKFLYAVLRVTWGPFVAQSSEAGAQPQIRAALDPDAKGGEYYGPTGKNEYKGPPGLVPQLPYALDQEEQDRLWRVAKDATGAVFPWELVS